MSLLYVKNSRKASGLEQSEHGEEICVEKIRVADGGWSTS